MSDWDLVRPGFTLERQVVIRRGPDSALGMAREEAALFEEVLAIDGTIELLPTADQDEVRYYRVTEPELKQKAPPPDH